MVPYEDLYGVNKVLLLLNEHGDPSFLFLNLSSFNTPNANMADGSVVARDELHESEASWAHMFCFDNSSPEKSCFVVDLVYFISLFLRVAVFSNAARRDRALPPFAS